MTQTVHVCNFVHRYKKCTEIRHDNFDYLNGQSEMGLARYNHVLIYLINRNIVIFVPIDI